MKSEAGSRLPPCEVVSTGIDYLTVTAKEPAKRESLWALGELLFDLERSDGNDPHPFDWKGYQGLSAGSVTVAVRDDGTLLRVSSALADEVWQDAARSYDSCSRIDLQVTGRFSERVSDAGALGYQTALGLSRARGQEVELDLRVSNTHSPNLYIGKRTSQLFARLYNKHEESRNDWYRDCWRWEVECKGPRAEVVLEWLKRAKDSSECISAAVYEHFVTRGVGIPWAVGPGRRLPGAPTRHSDDERRLRWLQTHIRPVVLKLMARVKETTVAEAVGLGHLAANDLRGRVANPPGRGPEQTSPSQGT